MQEIAVRGAEAAARRSRSTGRERGRGGDRGEVFGVLVVGWPRGRLQGRSEAPLAVDDASLRGHFRTQFTK